MSDDLLSDNNSEFQNELRKQWALRELGGDPLTAIPTVVDLAMLSNVGDFARYKRVAHVELINKKLMDVMEGRCKRLIVCLPPRGSKALALDTPIATPTGWTTMGELRIGDYVFGDDGKPCKVTWKSPIYKDRPVYDVVTDDGDKIVADEDHLWRARLCGKHPSFLLHTTKVIARPRVKRAMVIRQKSLELPAIDLPIDPYVLGYWLGDGHSNDAVITSGSIDIEWVRKQCEKAGYPTTLHKNGKSFGVTNLFRQLRLLGLRNNKHVPEIYLRASKEQRLALLQGLIDSDGCVDAKGKITFTSTKQKLSIAARELVNSLGYKASLNEYQAHLYGKGCGPYWAVSFYMAKGARMPRKQLRAVESKKTFNRYIKAILREQPQDTACISVDSPSHMYLAGKTMLPTHNSMTCTMALSAWFLLHYPTKRVAIVSYGSDLAKIFGQTTRDIIQELGTSFNVSVRQDSHAKDQFDLVQGGGLIAVGVGGSIVGKGFDLGILDDLIKDDKTARSQVLRDTAFNYYKGTFFHRRQNPDVPIVMVTTRWHQDDAAGRLIEASENGTGEHWEVLSLPAICEDSVIDPMGRKEGEPLWPELWPLDEMMNTKRELGSYLWSALYQQRPSPAEGTLFKEAGVRWFTPADEGSYDLTMANGIDILHVPKGDITTIIQCCDLATSLKTSADYTCIITGAVTKAKQLLILDIYHKRLDGPGLIPVLQEQYTKWKPAYIGMEKEGIGLPAIQNAKSTGLPVRALSTDGKDKYTRALTASARWEGGDIFINSNLSNAQEFIQELLAFPPGKHDDYVDALAHLANEAEKNNDWAAAFNIWQCSACHTPNRNATKCGRCGAEKP